MMRSDVVSGKWGIGSKIRITHDIHGHNFDIGEIVAIVDTTDEFVFTTQWEASNGVRVGCISESEGELE